MGWKAKRTNSSRELLWWAKKGNRENENQILTETPGQIYLSKRKRIAGKERHPKKRGRKKEERQEGLGVQLESFVKEGRVRWTRQQPRCKGEFQR